MGFFRGNWDPEHKDAVETINHVEPRTGGFG